MHFFRDTLKLLSATMAAQVLAFALSPVISRIYSPSDFGLSALFASLVSLIAALACLRYDVAVMVPASHAESGQILRLGLLLGPLVALITMLGFLLGGNAFLHGLHAESLRGLHWWIPIGVWLNATFYLFNYWNMRQKRFSLVGTASAMQAGLITILQIVFGLAWKPDCHSLIVAYLTGCALATGLQMVRAWRLDRAILSAPWSWSTLRTVAVRYRRFPLLSVPSTLMNTISWQLPIYLFSSAFSARVSGQYAMANKVTKMPLSILGKALGQVFLQRASQAKAEGNLDRLTEDFTTTLVRLGFYPTLLLAITARDIFAVLFGHQWAEAGTYAQILAPWLFFWFISSPLSSIFSILERQRSELVLNTIILSTRLIALGAGAWIFHSPRIALALFALSGAVVYGGLCLWTLHACRVSSRRMLRKLGRVVLTAIPLLIIPACCVLAHCSPLVVSLAAAASLAIHGALAAKTLRDGLTRSRVRANAAMPPAADAGEEAS